MSVPLQRSSSLTSSPFLDPLRRGYRRGRALVNRSLHPARRERARKQLEAMDGPRHILIICLGNICRSPYGEARLGDLANADGKLRVKSAGLMGSGRPSPAEARMAAAKNGVDLEGHRSELLDESMVSWADLVVVMGPDQARTVSTRFGVPEEKTLILGDLDPEPSDRREILDPYDRDEEFFQDTYERMDRCLVELYSLIREPS